MTERKEKLIKGIAWVVVGIVTIYIVYAFSKYGIDPYHNYGFPIF